MSDKASDATAAAPRGDIQVIARVAKLLESVSVMSPTLDTHQAAEILGVGNSSAHRYLASMEKAGLLQRKTAAVFVLGPALVRLGAVALAGTGLVEDAGQVMRDLANEIAGTIVLSVWGGNAPVVARVERNPHQTTTVSVDVGRSLDPDSAQSLVFEVYRERLNGRVIKSDNIFEFPEGDASSGTTTQIARHMYAEGALKAIAVPVLTPDGYITATLAVLGFGPSLPDDEDEAVTRQLIDGARKLRAS